MLGYTLAQPRPGCTCRSCAPEAPRYRRDGEHLLSSALWSLFWVLFLISLAIVLSYRCRGASERSRIPRSGACRGRLGFGPCKCPCLGLDRGVPVPSHCAPPHGAQQGRRRSRGGASCRGVQSSQGGNGGRGHAGTRALGLPHAHSRSVNTHAHTVDGINQGRRAGAERWEGPSG